MSEELKELAKEALAVQDACNLSGVAQSFARAMSKLRKLGFDTDGCNHHAITRLYLDKLCSLAGMEQDGSSMMRACYEWAKMTTEG